MHKEMWMIDIYRELGQVDKAIEKAKGVMEDDRFPNLKVYGAIRLLGIYADCKSDKASELIRVIDGIVIPETKACEDYLCLKAKYYDNTGNTDEAKKILHELKDKGKYTKSKSFAEENLQEGL